MNEINAWLACDGDGTQRLSIGNSPVFYQAKRGAYHDHGRWIFDEEAGRFYLCETYGHAINPGECRPVKLKVEVVL